MVARSVDRVAVGANDGGTGAGVVFVYARVGGDWVLEARFRDPTGDRNSDFGEAIALCGDRLAVGAPGDDSEAADSGTFYVFDLCPGDTSGPECASSCSDESRNAGETGTDCGGPQCVPCPESAACLTPGDCEPGFVCLSGACTRAGPP